MPWKSTIDRRRRLVYTRVSGTLRMADAAAHQADLARKPEFDPTFAHILDLRDVGEVTLSTNDMRALAQTKVFAPSARRVIVAASPSTSGLARIYGSYRERVSDDQVEVVGTMREAFEFTGAEPPLEPPV